MAEQQTATLETAPFAYQALLGDLFSWLGRDAMSVDIDRLRAEQPRLLCVLAGLQEKGA